MRLLVQRAILRECAKLIQRHGEYLHFLDEEVERKSARLGRSIEKTVHLPPWWSVHRQFNPYLVRCRADVFAHAIAPKIRQSSYRPNKALLHHVPKLDGTSRATNIFPVPDAAVSFLTYKSLLAKNYTRFSSYAYAYREDKSAFDAVRDIYAEWKNQDRVYVAEFDYSKFFDNIQHQYIWDTIQRNGFLATDGERHIMQQFMSAPASEARTYLGSDGVERIRGIPQGTSISLFLANVACWELDRELERLGVGFARYADDTAIWSHDYSRVVRAYGLIRSFGNSMGVPINLKKSEGIHLVATQPEKGEIRAKRSIDFLGHSISGAAVQIKASHLVRIKKRVSYLIYQNLLQPLNRGIFNRDRFTDLDLDYVVTLYQLRRYLYGGLNDSKLLAYLRGTTGNLHFRGLMSFYPLVNDGNQLGQLDGWIVHCLRQALRLRQRRWIAQGVLSLPGPHLNWIGQVDQLSIFRSTSGITYDLRVPSLSLINKAMALAIERKGVHAVGARVPSYAYP